VQAFGAPSDPDALPLCQLCAVEAPPFARALSAGSYRDGWRGLVHLLKYEGVRPAARFMGKRLALAAQPLVAEALAQAGAGRTLLLPVPLHKLRQRERGFNQAAAIARQMLRHLPREMARRIEWREDLLLRRHATTSQVGLTRQERRKNLAGAFAAAKGAKAELRGATILLVDDVLTTGATLAECSATLRQAGAAQVYALTVARAISAQVLPATYLHAGREQPPFSARS
jgi:ComF family protein